MIENVIKSVLNTVIGELILFYIKKFLFPRLRKYLERKRKKQFLDYVLKSKEIRDF